MNQETTYSIPPTHMYKSPIHLNQAVEQVGSFRYQEADAFSYGVIHDPQDIINYLQHDFPVIRDRQPQPDPKLGLQWAVGHFFMRGADGQTGFCVAPVLVKQATANSPAEVVDPFDPTCDYQYTYSCHNARPGNSDADDIYDMGEMWP